MVCWDPPHHRPQSRRASHTHPWFPAPADPGKIPSKMSTLRSLRLWRRMCAPALPIPKPDPPLAGGGGGGKCPTPYLSIAPPMGGATFLQRKPDSYGGDEIHFAKVLSFANFFCQQNSVCLAKGMCRRHKRNRKLKLIYLAVWVGWCPAGQGICLQVFASRRSLRTAEIWDPQRSPRDRAEPVGRWAGDRKQYRGLHQRVFRDRARERGRPQNHMCDMNDVR